CQHAYGIQLTF
nr:immunoglobulin light chain junction region [Macaca mulatta]MOW40724.1 immunoglobulin light chain junction region [Macaca mulatta]MOW41266.1 immunoglobulin light chain junction region [Macaca mulatta]MOW41439.1 immunoglobulin light chain junction region [Macaca mulatta]MOW41887.1 immunoglobulin light chain junction region [Macaca mulatta]